MRWKTTLFLAILFVTLGIFYYVYEIRLSPEREKSAQAKGRLWTVEQKDVEEVIVKRKADTVHVKRAGADWVLLAPVKARADRSAVDDLISNLVTTRVDREIDPNPAKLADFGLDAPSVDLSVKVKGKEDPLTLLLGGKNPTGVWVYGKAKDKPAVFTGWDSLRRDATKPVADFRDKTLLAFDKKDVTGLEIVLDGERMSVQPEAESKWKIPTPGALRARTQAISD